MAYGNYRGEWSRDRDDRWRSRDSDEDDSRRARESMEREREYFSESGRGGYGGWRGDLEDHAPRYSQGGRNIESDYTRRREYPASDRERHYGNEMGGWQGREEEQWRNRDVHGRYDRDANYGGFSSQGDYNYRGYERNSQERYGQEYGGNRGRGPRGYIRSDDRIREDVCDRLTDDDRLDATHIEVTVKDGEVTLSGCTTSRADKRWAESLVERISGVKEVQNSLRLLDRQRGQSSTQSSAQGNVRSGDRDSNLQH